MLIKTDPDAIMSYFEDSSNLKGGFAKEVAYPEDVKELSSFLKECFVKKIPVTVSGGGTGTTGARIPFGGAVVSTERLNRIIDISKEKMSARVQAGLLVEDLKNASERVGLFYTTHPTEKTASVGGTVATNASGARSFKYGPTRRCVKYLKMVMADGQLCEIRRGDRLLRKNDSYFILPDGQRIILPLPTYKMPDVKNSAGYFWKDGMDVIDLFIGQEGTLSIIVEIEIGLVRRPTIIFSLFIFFDSKENSWNFAQEVINLYRTPRAKHDSLSDVLSMEYFDSNALNILRDKGVNISRGKDAAIFLEKEMSEGMEEASLKVLEKLISRHKASLDDTWVAMNEMEAERFTKLRHLVPEAINDIVRKNKFLKLSTDIAVPNANAPDMMDFYVNIFKTKPIEHVIFGHIGESHLHVNLLPESEEELVESRKMCLEFARKGVSLGGTVSAEHGIGKTKHEYLEIMYGRNGVLEMARLKKALDANCLLGLDNIFPKEMLSLF